MIEIKMNNFPLNSINSKVFQNIMPKVMIILQLPLIILLNYFWKENSGKKVHYYVSKVVFSFSPSIFFIHLSIFYRKMPSLDKRKFLFHYKETFSRMTEHTSLQKQIKQVFFPWHYISYLYPGDIEAKTIEKREKIKK